MIVVGGLYREQCLAPNWSQIFGSGGRAAAALTTLSPGIELYTYVGPLFQKTAEAAMGSCGVKLRHLRGSGPTIFRYFHPLSVPDVDWDGQVFPPISVHGETVLRFGMMEGDAVVTASSAVFDPQSGDVIFRRNGSSADRVATVLNNEELATATGETSISAGVQHIFSWGRPEDVVVVKMGSKGVQVWYPSGEMDAVPAYRTDHVFKIGSGDVFSATFAHYWATTACTPKRAADHASQAVAQYVETRSLPIPYAEGILARDALPTDRSPGTIYLAGPFFSLAQRWLIEEAREILFRLGADVFSPIHDVGSGPPNVVAPLDLKGLEGCSAMLAIMDGGDPGTLYEIGYARARSIPVVLLAESVLESDLTMPVGTGCELATDLTSAAYRAVWASIR